MRGFVSAVMTSLVLATFTGCGSQSNQASGELSPEMSPVTLHVRNDNFQDVDLYAVHNGASTRVGSVVGNSSGVFKLNHTLFPTNDIAIVNGKPAERVTDLRKVEQVLRAGRLYDARDLQIATGLVRP